MRLLYYVSGHGYGHAVRSADVIMALHKLRADVHVSVRTTAPALLFRREDGPALEVSNVALDSGAIESGLFEVNAEATVSQLNTLFENRNAILEREISWARTNRVEMIVADIPWLAGDVAEACQIPCIGISNFLWNWIYEPFLSGHKNAAWLQSEIGASYAKFTTVLRLPMAHSMDDLACVRDVPLVATRSHRNRARLLEAIGCGQNDGRIRVLVSLRNVDSTEAISHMALRESGVLFLLPGTCSVELLPNVRTIEAGSDMSFSDLVALSDVVLAKPGYGIMSACAANRVRLMCLPRLGFREDEVLLCEGRQFFPIEMLPHEAFRNGSWGNLLRSLLDAPLPSTWIDLDGADVCAQIISASVG